MVLSLAITFGLCACAAVIYVMRELSLPGLYRRNYVFDVVRRLSRSRG